ncbi:MAG: hypothetical protein ACI37R_08385 [Candidatus Avigastranaerophilus sp.]
MELPYIKASFQQAAYNLENKIKTVVQTNKSDYVVDRLNAANLKIADSFFSSERTSKIFKKVEDKAAKDWASMHKVQNFILNNSAKISKGVLAGAIVASVATVATVLAKVAKSSKQDKQLIK